MCKKFYIPSFVNKTNQSIEEWIFDERKRGGARPHYRSMSLNILIFAIQGVPY